MKRLTVLGMLGAVTLALASGSLAAALSAVSAAASAAR